MGVRFDPEADGDEGLATLEASRACMERRARRLLRKGRHLTKAELAEACALRWRNLALGREVSRLGSGD